MLMDQVLDNKKSRAKLSLETIHLILQRPRFQEGTIPAQFRFYTGPHWQWALLRTQESQRHRTDEVTSSDEFKISKKRD